MNRCFNFCDRQTEFYDKEMQNLHLHIVKFKICMFNIPGRFHIWGLPRGIFPVPLQRGFECLIICRKWIILVVGEGALAPLIER
jgi:hypothetical protein